MHALISSAAFSEDFLLFGLEFVSCTCFDCENISPCKYDVVRKSLLSIFKSFETMSFDKDSSSLSISSVDFFII